MICYLKKEWMAMVRSGKVLILAAVFGLLGIMSPAIALFTPKLLEMMADNMADNGMSVTNVEVNALTSWQLFFKNLPMGLIVLVLVMSGIFVNEYMKGTLTIVVTKGAARWKIALAKYLTLIGSWTGSYLVMLGLTYGYNSFYWDNSIAKNVGFSIFIYWVFGIFVLTLVLFISTLVDSFSTVLASTAVVVMAMYLASMLPKVAIYLPTNLCSGYELMTSASNPSDYAKALIVTVVLIVIGFVSSIICFNRKSL